MAGPQRGPGFRMAGLGIGPEHFALFRIKDPGRRSEALETVLAPTLVRIGNGLVAGLSRVTGARLLVNPARITSHRSSPEEAFVAFCGNDRGYRFAPYLALAVTRDQLHARVAVRSTADRGGAMRVALGREAANLARKGKPFRKLRSYAEWDFEELPELAPASSAAFWADLARDLASERNGSGGIDVGIAWSVEEARSLGVGDVLGTFRDLAPIYKLLAHANARAVASDERST